MSISTFYMNEGENQNGSCLKTNFQLGMGGLLVAALTELQMTEHFQNRTHVST